MDSIQNIVDLPPEILIIIFTFLSQSDRCVLSECCKRFLEIWLRDIFIDDRSLVFNKCVLDPKREPLKLFAKSQRNYVHLVIGEIVASSQFSTDFAENITSVEFNDSFCYQFSTGRFLSQFPNLKTVKMEMDDEGFPDVPKTIELLVVSDTMIFPKYDIDQIKRYLNKTSDKFRIEMNFWMSTNDVIQCSEAQRNKILRLNLFVGDNPGYKPPFLPNLRYLEYWYSPGSGPNEVIDNLREQLPALTDLAIVTTGRLPRNNWPYLTTIEGHFIPKEELTRLGLFDNLKKLTLHTKDDCLLIHKGFMNKNLKEFRINSNTNELCVVCFKTITQSCPNLASMTAKFNVTNDHLTEFTNIPKLNSLTLGSVAPMTSFHPLRNLTELLLENMTVEENMFETWPLMFQLRKLRIQFRMLDLESVKIFERTPAVEDLRIYGDDIDNDHQLAVFEAMTKSLKRLKKFYVFFYQQDKHFKPKPGFVEVMAKNCKYLQKIIFNNNLPRDRDCQILIEKYPSLRSINSVWLK